MTPMEKVEILRACCCVAGADGECTPEEVRLLQKLADQVGVGQASLTAMTQRSETDPDFYQQQFKILKTDPQQTMAVLMQTALANGRLIPAEQRVLRGLADNLGVPEDVFQRLMQASAQMTDPQQQ